MNPYKILEVDKSTTDREIKQAYRRKSRECHPDRGGSDEAMQEVNRAYEVLSDPEKRAEYDQTGTVSNNPPIEARATQIIIQVYMEVLQQTQYDQGVNYDQTVKEAISQKLNKATIDRSQVNKVLPRIEKTLARAHGDQLIFSIQKMLNDGRRQLARLESDIKLYETALDQLKNFSIGQIQSLPTNSPQNRSGAFFHDAFLDPYPGSTGTGSGFFR